MDVLRISPPFSYTYQCGSTLLTAYLPVYMYSISLQILSVLAKLTFVFSSNLAEYPEWLMRLFPAVYWPVLLRDRHTASLTVNKERNWDEDGLTRLQDRPSIRLIRPYQILSSAMNNVILLLSFGLCSPILCCYITLNLSLTLCSWLMLIGRFVSAHLDLALVPSLLSQAGLAFSPSFSLLTPLFLTLSVSVSPSIQKAQVTQRSLTARGPVMSKVP